MPDVFADSYQPGKDTRPLSPGDLSPIQLDIIRQIEQRLSQVHALKKLPSRGRDEDEFLAHAEERHRRVLLVDGSRGTGKTSVLITLVQRWNPPAYAAYDQVLGLRPDFVRVLPILDFDPLPPGMPLAAGIIQAWRPLVNHYDALSRKISDWPDDGSDSLLDRWHRLFRVAAVGWAPIPQATGLIEQVLDREEQVGDWQHLDRQWYDFVEYVIEVGTRRGPHGPGLLPPDPVFVIMIDDVDLQVGRVRELLPALRLLYHPSVVFVVAAHREHLIDMLTLDFLGRQHELARLPVNGDLSLWTVANNDRWSASLAASAFEKVFPMRDQWRLKPLSLSELLEFPGNPFTFRDVLNARGRPHPAGDSSSPPEGEKLLGDYIRSFAELREKQGPGTPTVMTYRKAQQLADEVFTATHPRDVHNATTLLCRLLDPSDSDNLAVQAAGAHDPPIVEFRAVGEVTALFSPELIEVVYPRLQEIVLSGRPEFTFRAGEDSRASSETRGQDAAVLETVSSLAISLQDSFRSVVAPGVKWEARLSLAWTRWLMDDHSLDAAFRWHLHLLPTPLGLLEWAAEWAVFIRALAGEAKDRRDRMAYGWIYHMLRWLGASLERVDDPTTANLDDADVWIGLLEREPPPDTDSKLGQDRWRRRTLPLLARPEIGFTPKAQTFLLEAASGHQSSRDELTAERRRLVRDAFDAAYAARGERVRGGPEEEAQVDYVLSAIDRQYAGAPWYRFLEDLPESEAFSGDARREL